MSVFSPDEQFSDVTSRVTEALKSTFPVEGSRSKLVLHGVEIKDDKDSTDIRSQKKAIQSGDSWSVPVYGDVGLVRNGKEVNRRKVLLMKLPKTTDRFGYIVNGNEYQLFNQFRLKSGVYHRPLPNGQIAAEFNLSNPSGLANGRAFKVKLNPEDGKFYLNYHNSNVPLYHILKVLGADDKDLEKAWGTSVLGENRGASTQDKAVKSFVRALTGKAPKKVTDEHIQMIKDAFSQTELIEETTKTTLGKEFKTVNPELLTRSTKKLLDISRGKVDADDRDSLEFQAMYSAGDLLAGQIERSKKAIHRKIKANIDKKSTVGAIVPTDTFNKTVRGLFSSSLALQPDQTNPLEILTNARRTTIMGEQGGIQSTHAVFDSSKLINPSHLAFLDVVQTPEGEKTGVSMTLPLATKKKGNDLTSLFINAKSRKRSMLTSKDAFNSTVAFPDQYKFDKKGRPTPVGSKVKASLKGEIVTVNPSEVDYIIPSARGIFGFGTNLIPFLQNNQGNRAMTASRQQEQAVPLLHREAPKVQVSTDRGDSFEEVIGQTVAATSPEDGEVVEIKSDAVVIKNKKGEKREIQLYRDFALKGGSAYDSEIKVKKGDTVKKGQLLADTTFTKDGVLALGTGLRVGYAPWHGLNFEDGIVISESAAKKLTSLHIHQKDVREHPNMMISKKKYLANFSHSFKKDQLEGIGDDGLIRKGAKVRPGDPLVLALAEPLDGKLQAQRDVFRRGRPKKLKDRAMVWDKDYEGVVTDVVRKGDDIVVYVKTQEAAQIGDKLVGRHGNKGVITRVVPDSEMPYKENAKGDKEHLEILMNPLGIPGRINLGQVLETAAGKVATKQGKTVKIKNFDPDKNYLEEVKGMLDSAGLEDKEAFIDPATGKPFKQKILTGDQYILKLKHMATKKMTARSGAGAKNTPYDINHAPAGGSPHGGMSLGELGTYSLLAHGARENLWESFALKSNKNLEVWDALREGRPLPPPKTPFAYEKFLGYMNGLRVNVRKDGNRMLLTPFTEEGVLTLSNGEIKDPGLAVRGKDLQPIAGGLFDPTITGGMEGSSFSHFTLPEAMPNPLFEDAIKKLLGITGKQYKSYISSEADYKGVKGPAAIGKMLSEIDVKKELKSVRASLDSAKGPARDKAYKKYRILSALDRDNLSADVYMMKSVPVLPPVFRPVIAKADGSLSSDDMNGLYKDLGALIKAYNIQKDAGVPDSFLAKQRGDIYDGLKAMSGIGTSLTREYSGIIDLISGKTSKQGFFQKKVLKRRQDFSGRSIITPNPKLGLDQVGLPEKMAWEMYKPFIQRELTQLGKSNPLDALKEIEEKTPLARVALENAIKKSPVLLKRDPSLHKFNIMGFDPILTKNKAIEIHPLVTGGYNADFDGDTMTVYLPISEKARKEATKLYPSNNLFSATTGALMHVPGHEALLGMYLLSTPGKRTDKSFKTLEDAYRAERKGLIEKTDIIRVGGHETTVGRLMIDQALPPELRETGKKKSVRDMTVYDKKTLQKTLLSIAKSKSSKEYATAVDKFKDFGNAYSTELGYSVGLDDFAVINQEKRDKLIAKAEAEANKIRRMNDLSWEDRHKKIIGVFKAADKEIDKANAETLKQNPTNIFKMVVSGSRGKPEQLKQIISTPALVRDANDRIVPYLIPKSYAEGMDVASYWTTLHGARKGTIQKTQGVRDPGKLSKYIIKNTMHQLVTDDDCGTTDGVWMDVDDHDVLDRYVARNQKIGGVGIQGGALVTPRMVSAVRKGKGGKVYVRSPLRCKAEHGICKKCMGLDESGAAYSTGTNIGVLAAQSVGEPSTQLSMNAFHSGGLATGLGAKSMSMFDLMDELLKMPKTVRNEAPLAQASGKIEKVQKAPQGGTNVFIGGRKHYVPEKQTLAFKPGDEIKRGDSLTSDGTVNPTKLLPLKGMPAVQDHITKELHNLLKTAVPVKRRNIEVVVKSITDATKIDDPGDHPDWVPGDVRSYAQVQHWNMKNRGRKSIKHDPILKSIEVLPKELQEDWIARMNFIGLRKTISQAAQEGWASDIHGFHPIPGLARATEFSKKDKQLLEQWKGQY